MPIMSCAKKTLVGNPDETYVWGKGYFPFSPKFVGIVWKIWISKN